MLDVSPVHRGEKTSQQLAAGLTAEDLASLTREMRELQLDAIRDTIDDASHLEQLRKIMVHARARRQAA